MGHSLSQVVSLPSLLRFVGLGLCADGWRVATRSSVVVCSTTSLASPAGSPTNSLAALTSSPTTTAPPPANTSSGSGAKRITGLDCVVLGLLLIMIPKLVVENKSSSEEWLPKLLPTMPRAHFGKLAPGPRKSDRLAILGTDNFQNSKNEPIWTFQLWEEWSWRVELFGSYRSLQRLPIPLHRARSRYLLVQPWNLLQLNHTRLSQLISFRTNCSTNHPVPPD
jgi:hypothetical protein